MEAQHIRPSSQIVSNIVTEAERLAEKLKHNHSLSERTRNNEKFWKFRPYQGGESVSIIDWRQSARVETLYVREREQSLSETYYFWIDPLILKNNEVIFIFAFIRLLLGGEEKVAWLSKQNIKTRGTRGFSQFIEKILKSTKNDDNMPPLLPLEPHSHIILCGNFSENLIDWNDKLRNYSNIGMKGLVFHVGNELSKDLSLELVKNTGWHYLARIAANAPISELLRLIKAISNP